MRQLVRATRRLGITACLVLATSGCSREERGGNGADGFAVDSQPILILRGTAAGGEAVFGTPRGAARLSSGEIAVADGDPTMPAVVFFDPQGRKVRSVGRSGTGPGEYRTIAWLKQCGPDSLYVYDYWLRRVAVLRGDGAFVREFQLPTFAQVAGCPRSGLVAILGTAEMQRPASGRFRATTAPLTLADARGNPLKDFGQVPAFDLALTDFGGWMPRLAGRIPSVALSSDRVYVGPSDSSSVIVFALDGRRLPSIAVRVAPRAPERRHLDAAADFMVSFAPPSALRDRMRERFLNTAVAEHLPPFSTLAVDPDGVLWANLSVPGDTVTVLRAFDATGKELGEARIPVALAVFEIGSDYVLGGFEDKAGEPAVALYRLRRAR